MNMVRHAQLGAAVPASPVKDEHNLHGRTRADVARELGEFHRKERDADCRGEMEDGAARGGMHEAHQVAPRVAVFDRRDGPLAVETPDFMQDRLQADAVFVDGPQLDLRLVVRGRDRTQQRPQLFLKACCAAGSACTWRGRGRRRLPSSRTR